MSTDSSFTTGVVLVLAGAVANGSFGLLLKYARAWKWEHLWLTYSAAAMLLIPWALALATVPDLAGVLRSAGLRDLAPVFLFGLGWGIGSVLYGLALDRIGLALSYAIVMGLTSAIGSLAPLALVHREELFTARGRMIAAGVALIVVGVVLSAWAGSLKEKARSQARETAPAGRDSFALGLAIAVLSGILSPMLNLSFAYGGPLARLAEAHGTRPLFAANIIWVVALGAGFLVNAGYCARLISRAGTWRRMSRERFHYGLGAAMGALWASGIICYGIGGSRLGELAAVVGWPLMSSMAIISANFWGAVAGEWAGSGRKPRVVMWISVAVLCGAMFVIGVGDRLGRTGNQTVMHPGRSVTGGARPVGRASDGAGLRRAPLVGQSKRRASGIVSPGSTSPPSSTPPSRTRRADPSAR